MHIFYQPEIANGGNFLDAEESAHCCLSLRHKAGDIIHVVDGNGNLYSVRIMTAHGKKCEYGDIELVKRQEPPLRPVHLAIAPTKNADRLEWMVEKLCELGVPEISLVQCKHSERKVLKTDRLEKKAVSALKQSKNLYKTKIGTLEPLSGFLSRMQERVAFKAIAVVADGNIHLFDLLPATAEGAVVLIGPEGDFTADEVKLAMSKGFCQVSLGEAVLRTETAGLVACHSAMLKLRG